MKYQAKSRFTFYDEFDIWNEISCEIEVEAGDLNEAIEKIVSETRRRTLADFYSQPIGVEIIEIRDENNKIVYKLPSKDAKNEDKDAKNEDPFVQVINRILSLLQGRFR